MEANEFKLQFVTKPFCNWSEGMPQTSSNHFITFSCRLTTITIENGSSMQANNGQFLRTNANTLAGGGSVAE
jgi:hypothetical protein